MVETFVEYMKGFLREHSARDVIEVGSDVQFLLASRLAGSCTGTFYSLCFPEDHRRMAGWYALLRDMGGVRNVGLLSGNAVDIGEVARKENVRPDVILLQNVLIAPDQASMDLWARVMRREVEISDRDGSALLKKFTHAHETAYAGFLKLAKPGYVVAFNRPEAERLDEFRTSRIIEKLGVGKDRVTRTELIYDRCGTEPDDAELWEALVIDNT